MATARHAQAFGTTRKIEPAASAIAPTSQGLGTQPGVRAGNRAGRRNATTIAAMQTIAATANCTFDAMKWSCLISKRVDAIAARTNRTVVTVSPIPFSHGVAARSGTSASTNAIETEMLHTV